MKILTIFGTRPEAIKMAPVIKALKEEGFESRVCVTAQHREMLDQVLEVFAIEPDWDLDIMVDNQTLFDLTASLIQPLGNLLEEEKPAMVLVQGDTTTTFIASLAAYYKKIKLGHIEAGLRSYDKYNPFPEEVNRICCDHLADFHFAPTESARSNLHREGVKDENIWVTGNTGIDALFWATQKLSDPRIEEEMIEFSNSISLSGNLRLILVTGHRRESWEGGIENICRGLARLAGEEGVEIVYSLHPNPRVRKPVNRILGHLDNIHVINPPSYLRFVYLMNKSYFMLTDSGGIQEEAPALGKPVLVTRQVTERREGIKAGTAKLVGTHPDKIYREAKKLLYKRSEYEKMAHRKNPYGDGNAALRIVRAVKKQLPSFLAF